MQSERAWVFRGLFLPRVEAYASRGRAHCTAREERDGKSIAIARHREVAERAAAPRCFKARTPEAGSRLSGYSGDSASHARDLSG